MDKTFNTEARPNELSEDQLDSVAGAGGLMIERRGKAVADTSDTDSARGIVIHE